MDAGEGAEGEEGQAPEGDAPGAPAAGEAQDEEQGPSEGEGQSEGEGDAEGEGATTGEEEGEAADEEEGPDTGRSGEMGGEDDEAEEGPSEGGETEVLEDEEPGEQGSEDREGEETPTFSEFDGERDEEMGEGSDVAHAVMKDAVDAAIAKRASKAQEELRHATALSATRDAAHSLLEVQELLDAVAGEGMPEGPSLKKYPGEYDGEGPEQPLEDPEELAKWMQQQVMDNLVRQEELAEEYKKAAFIDECEAAKKTFDEQRKEDEQGPEAAEAVLEVARELERCAVREARRLRRERRRMREAERLLDPQLLRKWLEGREPCECAPCVCAQMDRKREYENPFPDFSADGVKAKEFLGPGPQLRNSFLLRLQAASNTYLSLFQEEWQRALAKRDPLLTRDATVYTGLSGAALHLYVSARRKRSPLLVRRALAVVHRALPLLRGRRIGFLGGDAGPLALAAALHRLRGERNVAQHCVARLRELLPLALNLRSGQSSELLHGRAGFLYALLFANAHVAAEAVPAGELRAVVEALLRACQRVAADEDDLGCPLLVRWEGHLYLGAAHGLTGVLFALLAARSYLTGYELRKLVRPALSFLQDQMLPTDNLPARVDEETDKQVQWCIGAAGAVPLFTLAYRVYREQNLLDTALAMGRVVWKRGLLTKGYGLCHGVSGNAFAFIALYQLTDDMRWLYRACAFAEWCFAYGCYQEGPPERPLSLFEGVLGVAHFLLELQEPKEAAFPGYSILT